MPTTSSTLVSSSYTASCTDLISPLHAPIVAGVTYASVSPSYYRWITGYYSVSEAITVPDLELPVTTVRFVASELNII